MKKKLITEHQQFIIIQLARFFTPTEIMEMLQADFGVKISRAAVSHYDPTLQQSRGSLKPEFIELFEQTRADFINEVSQVAISHRAYRLRQLDRICRTAYQQGNYVLAMQALEQAAKECGGFYERNKSAGTISHAVSGVVSLEDWKRLRATLSNVG
jgi:hypothetical protein